MMITSHVSLVCSEEMVNCPDLHIHDCAAVETGLPENKVYTVSGDMPLSDGNLHCCIQLISQGLWGGLCNRFIVDNTCYGSGKPLLSRKVSSLLEAVVNNAGLDLSEMSASARCSRL